MGWFPLFFGGGGEGGGGPNNEDYRILGSALGFLLLWEATMCIITHARFRVGFGCVVPGEGGRTEVYMGI